MADAKISAFTAATSPALTDLLAMVDVSDTSQAASGSLRKITLDTLMAYFQPTGSVIMFAEGTTVPDGYLECNGQAVSRTTYNRLFNLISTTWGSGNGSTTFNLPDLRGRAPIGVGTGSGLTARALAATGGTETHQLTTAQMPSHTHNIMSETGVAGSSNALKTTGLVATQTQVPGMTVAAGSDNAHPNMQPWLALRFLIKT